MMMMMMLMMMLMMMMMMIIVIMIIPGEGVNRDQAVCEQLSGGQKEVIEREIAEGNDFLLFHVLLQFFASYFVLCND